MRSCPEAGWVHMRANAEPPRVLDGAGTIRPRPPPRARARLGAAESPGGRRVHRLLSLYTQRSLSSALKSNGLAAVVFTHGGEPAYPGLLRRRLSRRCALVLQGACETPEHALRVRPPYHSAGLRIGLTPEAPPRRCGHSPQSFTNALESALEGCVWPRRPPMRAPEHRRGRGSGLAAPATVFSPDRDPFVRGQADVSRCVRRNVSVQPLVFSCSLQPVLLPRACGP